MYLGLEQMLVEEQEISCSVQEDFLISEPKDLQLLAWQILSSPSPSLKSKIEVQVSNTKSKVQGKGTGTGADNIILQDLV